MHSRLEEKHGFKIGEEVFYFPLKKLESDNIHWPAIITAFEHNKISLLVKTPDGEKRRSVAPARIAKQHTLPL